MHSHIFSQKSNALTRRKFLKTTGIGALGLLAGGFSPLVVSPSADSRKHLAQHAFEPDLEIVLRTTPGKISLLPGNPTQIWRFDGKVLKGDPSRLVKIPGSYLGPTIKVNKGEKVRIWLNNQIPQSTIVHWHGLHVPANMDGHPRQAIDEGQYYLYEFEVKNRAGTYWYHPHPHGRTGPQVYKGLAGLFLVSDEEETNSGLPRDEFDIPLVIQDRSFGKDNQLIYLSGHPMERMNGFLGEQILVNGKLDFMLPVATCAYRLRLLNGSNSRIYKLAWQDGRPLIVVGSDGGLLEKPIYRRYAFLAPGERLELWADFSDSAVGYETALMSLPFDAGSPSAGRMGRGMMMGRRMGYGYPLSNGERFSIFKIEVRKRIKKNQTLPQKLSEIRPLKQDELDNLYRPKMFYLTMRHMQWTINDRVFQMEEVARDEVVQLGTKQIWEFNNTGGGMGMMHMMNIPHPIHLHGQQFRIIERNGVLHDGYVDEGWKDTVLLMPGERIRILVGFDEYSGIFLYHCHNLEHEDMGMMRNYFARV